jgi:hypothetical protein
MKTILTSFLIFISLVANSQIIEVNIAKLTKYSHSENLTLHSAIESDSLTYLGSWDVKVNYVFDLNKMTMKFKDTLGEETLYNIVKIIPSESHLNVDAESPKGKYNYVLADNVDDTVSFIIQNFQIENGARKGYFSNDVQFSIK